MAFEKLISDKAGTQEVIDLIIATINEHQHSKFVQDFTRILEPDKTSDFLKRLFDAVCHYVKYERDPIGHERVKTPKRLFVDAFKGIEGGDCKKMSTAIASVLKAAGIEPLLKVISYDGINWEHIYVIVTKGQTTDPHTLEFNGYYILDPVNDCKFNSEIPHAKAVVYNLKGDMNKLSILGNNTPTNNGVRSALYNGIEGVNQNIDNVSMTLLGGGSLGCPGNDYAKDAGLGLKNEYFEYTVSQKVLHVAKVPAFAIPRNAFLGILYLGKVLANTPLKLNITKRLAAAWMKDKNRVRKTWWLLGGTADAAALRVAIAKGSGISLSGIPLGKGYDYPIDLVTPYRQAMKENLIPVMISGKGMGEPVTLATIGAAIIAAAPIIAASKKMLSDMGILKAGETDPPVPPDTAPPADPPPGGGPTPPGQGSVTGLALALILDQWPLYISLPVIAYTLYHYRKVWTAYIPFIKITR